MGPGQAVILEAFVQDGPGMGMDFKILRLNQAPSGGITEGWVRGRMKLNP